MYAIVKTGGKQYRVEEGQTLLVERLGAGEGDKVALEPLMLRADKDIVDGGDDLAKVKVEATVVGHERGKKIRVFKYKPKRGYSRRSGHRQELTRLEVTSISQLKSKPRAAATKSASAEKKPAASTAKKPAATAKKPAAATAKKPSTAKKPARAAKKPAAKNKES